MHDHNLTNPKATSVLSLLKIPQKFSRRCDHKQDSKGDNSTFSL